MFQSKIPDFATKEFPKYEESYNSRILIRAGFIDKLMSGVYSYLPFGLKVLTKIGNVVREHMDKLGSEILMPVLHPKENWEITRRWNTLDVLFKVISKEKREYALGATHEEVVVPLAQHSIFSYKDLPFALYQIQTKFRDEPRAKSGLLRGREFIMKDLYSFHTNQDDLKKYYETVKEEYKKIFLELELDALLVEASGGTFSKFSHEFQVQVESGEDTIIMCESCDFAQNMEINSSEEGSPCPKCGKPVKKIKASEIGNIFELNTRYSEPFSLTYKNKEGKENIVYMGCYGIGVSRLMGVIAEIHHDDNGLIWPASVAPFDVHLVALFSGEQDEDKETYRYAEDTYNKLKGLGIDVLFDDRRRKSAGEKLTEADLIGIPVRLIISKKTKNKIEFKLRKESSFKIVDIAYVLKYFNKDK